MKRLATFALLFLCLCTSAIGQMPMPAVNTSPVPPSTTCGNATIPAGNTVANTAAETAFASACVLKPSMVADGSAVHLHVGGTYNAASLQNATGKVKFTNNASIAVATDTTLINTGSVGGLANATNQDWWGDVYLTFQSSNVIDVHGLLGFQSGSNVLWVPLVNTSTFAVDRTKDLTLYLTVQWGAAMIANSMTLRTMVAK